MTKTSLVPVLAALLVGAMPAQAAITVVVGAPGVKTEENVLFKNLGPAAVIETSTNKGTLVSFTGNEILDAPAGGQAKITGADGQFNTLNFFPTDPLTGFSAVEFSLKGLQKGQGGDTVTATVTFFDQFGAGTTITAAPLPNGQNWFAAFATPGSVISRVEITTSADIRDARHFRMDGALAGPIPEPSTWLMLIGGFGVVGGAMRRRGQRPALAGA